MKQVQTTKSTPVRSRVRAFLDQIFTDRNQPSYSEDSANRYSVLYMLNGQYQHIGCATQEEAQLVQGMMLTDANRVPVGIYDSRTDSFEWEIVGEYLAANHNSQDREEKILTIARALRRRDGSWHPAYLRRPSFFA